jgi:hypothetical protein
MLSCKPGWLAGRRSSLLPEKEEKGNLSQGGGHVAVVLEVVNQ